VVKPHHALAASLRGSEATALEAVGSLGCEWRYALLVVMMMMMMMTALEVQLENSRVLSRIRYKYSLRLRIKNSLNFSVRENFVKIYITPFTCQNFRKQYFHVDQL